MQMLASCLSSLSTLFPSEKDIPGRRTRLSEVSSSTALLQEGRNATGATLVFSVAQMGESHLMQTGLAEASLSLGPGQNTTQIM